MLVVGWTFSRIAPQASPGGGRGGLAALASGRERRRRGRSVPLVRLIRNRFARMHSAPGGRLAEGKGRREEARDRKAKSKGALRNARRMGGAEKQKGSCLGSRLAPPCGLRSTMQRQWRRAPYSRHLLVSFDFDFLPFALRACLTLEGENTPAEEAADRSAPFHSSRRRMQAQDGRPTESRSIRFSRAPRPLSDALAARRADQLPRRGEWNRVGAAAADSVRPSSPFHGMAAAAATAAEVVRCFPCPARRYRSFFFSGAPHEPADGSVRQPQQPANWPPVVGRRAAACCLKS